MSATINPEFDMGSDKAVSSDRETALIPGILFLLGFAGVVTASLIQPVLAGPDYLVKIAADPNRFITGAFFQLVMAAACAGIGISLYPVLRRYNEGLALGAAGFRIIEAVFQISGVVILLLLLALSREFETAGAMNAVQFRITGALLRAGNESVNEVAVVLPWCLGALMYYYIFYRTKLIPRWLSAWGLVGITSALTASLLFLFGLIRPFSTIQVVLMLPIASQELMLAAWLIVKGFNASEVSEGLT